MGLGRPYRRRRPGEVGGRRKRKEETVLMIDEMAIERATVLGPDGEVLHHLSALGVVVETGPAEQVAMAGAKEIRRRMPGIAPPDGAIRIRVRGEAVDVRPDEWDEE